MKRLNFIEICLLIIIVIISFINCGKQNIYEDCEVFEISDSIETIPGIKNDTLAYLYSPTGFVFNQSKFIITEPLNYRILVCDSNLNFIKSFGGRQGKGPNEFVVPSYATLKNNKLYVHDWGSGIKIFDFEENELLNRMKIISPFLKVNFVVNNKGNILISNISPEEPHLFTEYSEDGKIIKKYGKRISVSDDPMINFTRNVCKLYSDESDSIYYALFMEYPLLRKYNEKGELIWEKNIADISKFVKHAHKLNLKWEKNHPNNKHQAKEILADLSVYKDKLFISAHIYKYDDIILCLDKENGKLLYKIKAKNENNYCYKNFVINRNKLYLCDRLKNRIFIAKPIQLRNN